MQQGKGFGFGLGKMKELAAAFQKAQQVQESAKEIQQELELMEVTGQSGDGLVIVTMSGTQEPLNVEIKPNAITNDSVALSNLVTEALKDAHKKSTEIMREKMESLTSGLGLPSL